MVLDGNAVRSVDRAAALLLALGDAQGEAGVTELARRLGLHKSTASRLLASECVSGGMASTSDSAAGMMIWRTRSANSRRFLPVNPVVSIGS